VVRERHSPGPSNSSRHPDPAVQRLLDVILRLYQAATQPNAPQAMMSATASLFDTGKAMYIRLDRARPSDSVTEIIGLAPRFADVLKNRKLEEDNIWRTVWAIPAGGIFMTSEMIPRAVLSSRPLYSAVTVPAGIEFAIGAVLENGPECFCNVCYMRGTADFDGRHRRILAVLVPHLQMALQFSRRIAVAESGRREALRSFDRARQPVVILDRSGFAIHVNDCARRVLRDADGIDLKFGRFLFDDVSVQAEFERALCGAVASIGRDIPAVPRQVKVKRRSSGSLYVLVVVPLPNTSDRALLPDGTACAILIHDLDRVHGLPLERLAALYQLTPAELRTCESLYRTGSVDSAARSLSLTRNTVRSHLKSIYAKFGVANQGQLVLRLANSVSLGQGMERQRHGTS
jgi:DNA-binding CsgD family transcriptional regulator